MAAAAVTRWLLKVEPEPHVISGIDMGSQPFALLQSKGRLTYEGVRNFAARNTLRDRIKQGHHVFYYHSSCKEPAIMGIAEVARAAFPDPAALDPKHPFYDAKHTAAAPRWFNVELKPVRALKRPVTLAELRAHGAAAGAPLAEMTLLRQSRLSVQPVTDAEWAFVLSLEDAPAPAPAAAGGGAKKAKKAPSAAAAAGDGDSDGGAAAAAAAPAPAAPASKRRSSAGAGDRVSGGAAAAKKARKAAT